MQREEPCLSTSFHLRPVALASSTATMSIAPSLLVAATAVQISADLHLDIGQVGLAVSGFYGATAVTTAALGRLVSRQGPRRSLMAVMTVNAAVLVILGLAQNIWVMAAALLAGGVANGAVHPASNVVLAQGVRGHLGLALGIKQSAMPAAGLAGGLAVPAIALTVGWRWAFAVAALVSCGLIIAAFCHRPDAGPARLQVDAEGVSEAAAFPLRLLSVGVCCGAAAGTSLTVLLISGAVASKMLAPGAAGLLAAGCGTVAVLARIGLGWRSDRRPDRDPTVNAFVLLVVCCVGGTLMATGSPVLFVLGATLAAGLGFGWTGLVHLATMRAHAEDPARATGTLMTGFAGGSFLGPLVLAQVASQWGYRPVWVCVAVLAVISAVALAVVTRSGRRSLAPR
jgi:MFS family permease